MRVSCKFLGLTILGFSSTTFALNIVPGWYGGILAGPTYMPAAYSPPLSDTALGREIAASGFTGFGSISSIKAELQYKLLANIGLMGGYRCSPFRIEGELYLNSDPYNFLRIGSVTIHSPKSSTGLRIKGATTTGAILLNGFFDLDYFTEYTSFVPFVGLGIGYAGVQNNIKFYYNNVLVPGTSHTNTQGTPAAQGIIGTDYFWDDYTTVGVDFRYFSTEKVGQWKTRDTIYAVNIAIKGSFNSA